MPIDFFQGLLEVPHKLEREAGYLLPPPLSPSTIDRPTRCPTRMGLTHSLSKYRKAKNYHSLIEKCLHE